MIEDLNSYILVAVASSSSTMVCVELPSVTVNFVAKENEKPQIQRCTIPSGMSVMCQNLLKLSALLPHARDRYLAIAESTLLRLAERAQRSPIGFGGTLRALDLLQHGLVVTIVVLPPGGERSHPLVTAATTTFVPDHFVWIAQEGQALPEPIATLCEGKSSRNGAPTAYVCRGERCSAPIVDPAALRTQLQHP